MNVSSKSIKAILS
ncbi:hypothetical protein ECEC4402_4475, partial [Escherichia coli EC4402]